MSTVIVQLPAHRIAPGAVVAVTGPDRRPRTIVLPDDVTPGSPVLVQSADLDVVIRLLD